jgi:rSAM/selenodomain-associated transferase 2
MVSIIVPTLNEELAIGPTLRALLTLEGEKEIIVSDGGSTDKTVEIAGSLDARVVYAQRGRGSQMHAGASAASGEVLWFVHADTTPPSDALHYILNALDNQGVCGGNFGLQFDGESHAARLLTSIYPCLRVFNLCYGDSGIFCRRSAYDAIGGFRPLALFEDLDLLRRLHKQGRFVHLKCRIVTSSRRFENRNFPLMWAHWSTLQVLYWFGVDPNRLARHYAHVRHGASNAIGSATGPPS